MARKVLSSLVFCFLDPPLVYFFFAFSRELLFGEAVSCGKLVPFVNKLICSFDLKKTCTKHKEGISFQYKNTELFGTRWIKYNEKYLVICATIFPHLVAKLPQFFCYHHASLFLWNIYLFYEKIAKLNMDHALLKMWKIWGLLINYEKNWIAQNLKDEVF